MALVASRPMNPSASLHAAMSFLKEQQSESGQFPATLKLKTVVNGVPDYSVQPDLSPFPTSHIVYSLEQSRLPAAATMIEKAVEYLRREQVAGGLWRYWDRGTPIGHQMPTDVDDTACVSDLLSRLGGGRPRNEKILFLNRNSDGLFYTWIIPRLRSPFHFNYWRVLLSDANYQRMVAYWRLYPARRDDVEPVVNANALLYLGLRPETRAVIDYLIATAAAGAEHTDKYYCNAYAFYHAASRCYARGIEELAPLKSMMERHLVSDFHDGRIGPTSLHTALALCACLNFGVWNSGMDAAVSYLLQSQMPDGGWPWAPFYFDGRAEPTVEFGARSLTTGFCVEVLARILSPRH
jgi:hypothetical protein